MISMAAFLQLRKYLDGTGTADLCRVGSSCAPFRRTRKGYSFIESCRQSHEGEGSMNLLLRDFLLVVTLAGVATTPAWGQSVAPSAGPAGACNAS